MKLILKHWPRIAITLLPLLFVSLHAVGFVHIGVLQRLDDIIYDARLRATMPKTLDERIVIVDIDEKSLAEVGRWPWGRNKMGDLTNELFDGQKIALLGFDVVFAEVDESSGLKRLNELAKNELRDQPGFAERIQGLQSTLDYDATFAKALEKRSVVMGYYLTSDRDGRSSGVLPETVMPKESVQGRPIRFTSWNGYGSNIPQLAKAAPLAGFFNSITETDGVVRSLPLIAEYKGTNVEEGVKLAASKAFNKPLAEIKSSYNSKNMEGWDSIAHLDFITTIESSFNIKLSTSQIMSMNSIQSAINVVTNEIKG